MRVAIVTGAAQGIGRRTAQVLGEAGYNLLLLDLQSCEATLSALPATGFEAEALIVNIAGISFIAPAEMTEASAFRRVLEINLVAPFVLSRIFGSIMLEQREGSIVNVASIAGLVGVSDRSIYNASKHGLVGLTRTLAGEWGGRGVRVNAVCPGWVKTEMDVADQVGGGYTDDDITGRVPMARFARPDDIARAILFLADPSQSGFVNGHALAVDGGWTADGSWQSLRLHKR